MAIVAHNSLLGMAEIVPIFQGASKLFEQRTCQLSEAACATKKLEPLVKDFRKACTNKSNTPLLRLESNGMLYQCNNPVQSSASLYVAHYNPFLERIQNYGLKSFEFEGKIADEKKCPYVSFLNL